MKKKIIICISFTLFFIFTTVAAFAAVNDVSVPAFINSVFRYDFDNITEAPDSGSDFGDFAVTHDEVMVFTPVDLSGGWLFEFSGGDELNVEIGTLSTGDRYIDLDGKNGKCRYLINSSAAGNSYNKSQFWSAKQQDGSSIIKDFNGEIKCIVLYEFIDGSCYLSGYIDGDGTDFWTLELPTENYFKFEKQNG